MEEVLLASLMVSIAGVRKGEPLPVQLTKPLLGDRALVPSVLQQSWEGSAAAGLAARQQCSAPELNSLTKKVPVTGEQPLS